MIISKVSCCNRLTLNQFWAPGDLWWTSSDCISRCVFIEYVVCAFVYIRYEPRPQTYLCTIVVHFDCSFKPGFEIATEPGLSSS